MNTSAPRARRAQLGVRILAALLPLAAAACEQVLGFDQDTGGSLTPDGGGNVSATTVTGMFTSGGATSGPGTRVRGAFSWGPSATVSNGTTTVTGGFH